MKIEQIHEQKIEFTLFKTDENNREINIYKLENVISASDSLFYPNVLFLTHNKSKLINPINETIMSLSSLEKKDYYSDDKLKNLKYYKEVELNPLFFFVYNTDNYFHFIYDTIPYLISFIELKKNIPNIKLLMNYPNISKNSHYDFVIEFLEILGISKKDIIYINNTTTYKEIYVSTSYTHGPNSNKPPRKEVYSLFKYITSLVDDKKEHPKKIYVSRRSWVHNDLKNIGTNYTTRRKMVNENELVDYLIQNGYEEIFTEKLTTIEKINMFKNATHVVGAIGGGISNVLFSNKQTKLLAIESPNFLKVNERFIFSLENVDLKIFNDTKNTSNNLYKKYMRVKFNNIIGEITDIVDDNLTISYLDEFVAGWNNDFIFKTITVKSEKCEKLDDGLNSEWYLNLDEFKKIRL